MEQNGLFHLVVYDYKHLADEHTPSILCSGIKNYFLDLLAGNDCDVNAADEIFVSNSGAYCLFELFLALLKIPYSLVEFSKNEFANRSLVKSISQYEEISPAYRNLAFAAGTIIGANDCCKKHIYCAGSELDKTLPGKIYFFDPFSLRNLREETKEKVVAAYPETDFVKIGEISTLLVPNSESLTKRAIASCGNYINDNIAPYTLLIDLLEIPSERLMIKPHPHGSFSFETRFPCSFLLEKTFLIEFLQLIPNCRIKKMISIETSAVDKVSNMVESNIVASRYWMLKLVEILPLYTTLLLEAKLLDYKLLYFYPDSQGVKEIAQILSECMDNRRIVLENRFLELGATELAVAPNYENAARFSSCIHKYTIVRKNIADIPVFSDGSSSLYIAGNISSTECKEAELSFNLKHSGIEVFLKYEGEC